MIPKPQNLIAFARKPSVAHVISDTPRMLRTIRFDNEFMLNAEEVGDVGTNRRLATKFDRLHAPITQGAPKLSVRVGKRPPHGSGARFRGKWNIVPHERLLSQNPHPADFAGHLLPQAGEGVHP